MQIKYKIIFLLYLPPPHTHTHTNREMKPLHCLQVNLQHKHAATRNLVQMMSDNEIDLAFVQEPYNIHNHLAGIRKSLTNCVRGDGRKQSALFVNNKEIGVVLITQFSDEDCIVAVSVVYVPSSFSNVGNLVVVLIFPVAFCTLYS
jgi:hypothetical protein